MPVSSSLHSIRQYKVGGVLGCFQEKGLLKSAKQRTDSTHVIAAVRQLRRLELAGETMRAALNAIAAAEPDWLRSVAKPEWFERYSHRVEEYRFPKGKDARRAYGDSVAQDGLELLTVLEQPDTPSHLNTLGMVNVLKAVWQQNFEIENGTIRWLTPAELKPSGERFNSPYDTEAFYSTRRETEWIGYKVHVSETCEDDVLRVITHVQTTASVTQDVSVTADIHQALADKALLPGTHIVDTGYTDAELLATSQAEHRVRLIGPVRENLSWQAKAAQGFSQDDFVIDWDKEQARCPQGKLSYRWEQKTNNYGLEVMRVKFRSKECQACPVRNLCTKSTTNGRRLSLQAKESQEALQAMRVLMASDEGKSLYACRAGIEGTLSQGVRKMGLRSTRYRGLEKTHLQHLATAAAINVTRVVNWSRGDLPVTSRISPFARLVSAV